MGRTGLTGRRDQNGLDKGRAGGSTVADDGLGAPALSLEVMQTAGSGGCHRYHRCCRDGGVFVLVQQSNHNTLHKNPKS